MHYKLDENNQPYPVSIEEYLADFSPTPFRVGYYECGKTKVSTVFLGMDHSWGDGPPVLWETMIFNGQHDQYQERYTSYDDALAGHKRAVELVQQD